MTKRTVVVLVVTDDDESREWWEALRLPDPVRWHESFPDAHVKEKLVVREASHVEV